MRSLGRQRSGRKSTLLAAASPVRAERQATLAKASNNAAPIHHERHGQRPMSSEAEAHWVAAWYPQVLTYVRWTKHAAESCDSMVLVCPDHASTGRNATGRVAQLQASRGAESGSAIANERGGSQSAAGHYGGSWSAFKKTNLREDDFADLHRPPQRNLPARGFKPATLLALGGGVMLYGWYQFGKGAREQR